MARYNKAFANLPYFQTPKESPNVFSAFHLYITQIDFENKKSSGLVLAAEVLKSIKEIKFVNFTEEDVLRHGLVRKIVGAFEKWNKKQK